MPKLFFGMCEPAVPCQSRPAGMSSGSLIPSTLKLFLDVLPTATPSPLLPLCLLSLLIFLQTSKFFFLVSPSQPMTSFVLLHFHTVLIAFPYLTHPFFSWSILSTMPPLCLKLFRHTCVLSLNVINTVLHASETHGLNKCLNALNLGFSTSKSGV